MFFKPLISSLQLKGCEVVVTTQDYRENLDLCRHVGLNHIISAGKPGPTKLDKLKNYIERVQLLTYVYHEIQPHLAISMMNPETCHIAYALNVPNVCFCDNLGHDAPLTLPLATRIFAPFTVPLTDLAEYGQVQANTLFYSALNPLVWLRLHEVNNDVLKDLGIKKKPVIVVRGLTSLEKQKIEKLDACVLSFSELSNPMFDMQSILARCDVFIGAGETMNVEAAYYGTPVINSCPKTSYALKFLEENGLAVHASTPEQVVVEAKKALKAGRNNRKAHEVFGRMEFHMDQLCEKIMVS